MQEDVLEMEELELDGNFDQPLALGVPGPVGPSGPSGPTGPSGITPHIGENGNWFIGEEDTGVYADGSGVYVGSGEMPDGYNVQIDPSGDAAPFFEEVKLNTSKNLCNLGTITFERGSGYLNIGTTLEKGKTYTLSAEVTSSDTDSSTGVCGVYLAGATGSTIDMVPRIVLNRGGRASSTFVCPADNVSRIVFYAGATSATSDGDTATFKDIQIEEGSAATSYAPAAGEKVTTAIDYVAREKTNSLSDDIQSIANKEPIYASFASTDFEEGGITESGANSTNAKRIRTIGYVDVSAYSTIEYAITAGYRMYLVFFSDDSQGSKVSHTGWLTGSSAITVPNGAKYYRAQIASLDDATKLTEADCSVVTIKRSYPLMTGFNDIVTKTKWLAIGDSITFGVYSYMNGDTSASGETDGWVRRLANALGYDITVMASRGMGYTAAVTGQDPLDKTQPRISLDTLLTRIEDLTDDFNLITLAFGINDYATSSQATVATVEAGLDNAVQRLMAKFPTARLVVITPLNSSREGSASTNYAYGQAKGGRSLKDIADAIKTKCETYGVECIYASNGFLINNYNIVTLLPDNTHPSDYGHTLIAKNMAHYLLG